jgi:hypothetical protein
VDYTLNQYPPVQLQAADGSKPTARLVQTTQGFCCLGKVAIWGADSTSETSFCEVYVGSDGYWWLKAVSNGNSRVDCSALCILGLPVSIPGRP